MKDIREKRLQKSVAFLQKQLPNGIKTAVILGSAWSDFEENVSVKKRIPYREIPAFPRPTVTFQNGELLLCEIKDTPILVFSGRFHFYEGFSMWETAYPIFVSHLLRIEHMIITNAAGGVNSDYRVGDLVMVTDHLKFCAESPLRGENNDKMGKRFFEMQSVYDTDLQNIAQSVAQNRAIELHCGTYAYMTGPQFETIAEIRALRALGADVVGMSTVPEVIACAYCKQKLLCLSMVTNAAAGIDPTTPPNQEEVMDASSHVQKRYGAFLAEIVQKIAKEERGSQ